jgi:Ankyrin repeats (3 copies)/Ankyrin repeat
MQLDYVSSLKSDRAIRNALEDLPSGLDKVYDQVLAQIVRKPGYDPEVIRTILIWVSTSYSLLTTNEIAEAVSMRPDDKTFDPENVATDPEDLIGLCGSLLRLERVGLAIGDSGPVVGLVHYSAEEYLFSEHIAKGQLSYFRLDLHETHLHIAKQCLQYLALENFSGKGLMTDDWFILDSEILQLKKRHALLEYASLRWADHLRDSHISKELYRAQILPHLSWFLNPGVRGNNYQVWQSILHADCKNADNCTYQTPFYNAIAKKQAWQSLPQAHCEDDDTCAYQTPFYSAIVSGLQHVVGTLLPDHLPHINTRFHNGWTPLTAALNVRQESIAHLLLSAGANPNICADDQHNEMSALHLAAEYSMDDTVEMLLHFGASVHARTQTQTTPFYRAARGGSVGTLTLLHDHGSDVNARTWDDWTPLVEAVCNGHEAVVKKLLEWGAETTIRTKELFTVHGYTFQPAIRVMLVRHEEARGRMGQGTSDTTLPYRMNE